MEDISKDVIFASHIYSMQSGALNKPETNIHLILMAGIVYLRIGYVARPTFGWYAG
jgi:hypothetical protein